jgi:zona occludens toxin
MAVHLITGLPGASKTLNTIAMVDRECKDRPVYQYGVTDCKMPWTELTLDQLHTWWELPSGSVIFVDEAQSPDIWPAIPNNRQSPESVTRMDQHRKQGFDFYIITQQPTKIDHRLRGFAGPHFHYERVFSRNGAKETRFERAVSDPHDRAERAKAQTRWVPFPKKYFAMYKSAEVHTYKPKVPRAMYMLGAALVVCAIMGYRVLSGFGEQEVQTVAQPEPASGFDQLAQFSEQPAPGNEMTPTQYAAQFVPRIEDVPHSAPIYDGVTKVKTFPRPQCILRVRNNVCRCYTQQATPLDISHDACVNIVHNGVFDPFRDEQPETVGAKAAPAAAPAVEYSHLEDTPARVTRIGNTPVMTRREINLQPRSDRQADTRSF